MSLPRKVRVVLWWLAPAGFLVATAIQSERAAGTRASLGERLFGPIVQLVSTVQWVRVDEALRAGHSERAYQIASSALALNPSAPEGWKYLAHHFVYERGSLLAEPDRVARAAWVRAGIALLERGERESARPGPIAFKRGVVFVSLAGLADEDRAWPPTEREAWISAAEAFDIAAIAGEPWAKECAEFARERAAQLPP